MQTITVNGYIIHSFIHLYVHIYTFKSNSESLFMCPKVTEENPGYNRLTRKHYQVKEHKSDVFTGLVLQPYSVE